MTRSYQPLSPSLLAVSPLTFSSAMPITNVRTVSSLTFKDQSHYSGQVLQSSSTPTPNPHGYGLLTTPTGFSHAGLFHASKPHCAGIFTAPNGDRIWGTWDELGKRHGKGLMLRGSDSTQLVEEYSHGKLDKRVKRRPLPPTATQWLPSGQLHGGLHFAGTGPCGRAGHTCTVNGDESMLIVFGGETITADGITTSLNDLHLLDTANGTWLAPPTSGTVPPPMHGHTATLTSGRLVVIGGQLAGIESNSSVYTLDLSSGVWECVVKGGLPLVGHSASYVASKEVIVVLVQEKVFTLCCRSWRWQEQNDDRTTLRRSPRSFIGHAAVTVGDEVWVVGGKVLGGVQQNDAKRYERCTADVRVLHTDTWTWSLPDLAPPPQSAVVPAFSSSSYDTPRSNCCAVLLGHRLLVLLGHTTLNPSLHAVDESDLSDCWSLDLRSQRWEGQVGGPCWPKPRSEATAVVVGGRVVVFGGRNAGEAAIGQWDVLQVGDSIGEVTARAGASVSGRAVNAEESKESLTSANETGAFSVVKP